MLRFYFFASSILLIIYLSSMPGYGQQGLKFKHLGINEGLSQNSVFNMMQDHNGFIWVGTEDGLNKYDGYEFKIFKHSNHDRWSLSHSQVNAIIEDNDFRLWVGTASGLNVMDPRTDRFTRIKIVREERDENRDYISSLITDKKGNIWIGTYDGLKMFDCRQQKLLEFKVPGIPLTNYNKNKVKSIYLDDHQILWISIGTEIARLDITAKKFLPVPIVLSSNLSFRKSSVRVIRQDKSGVFWFGTESEGLFKYDVKREEVINFQKNNSAMPSNVVRDILLLNDQQIWIGTIAGLSILNKQTQAFSSYQSSRFDPLSLSHNSVRNFMVDASGSIWMGTFAGGINIYTPESNNFNNIEERIGGRPGLSHSVISSILLNPDSSLWIGTEGGGLNYVDRKRNIYRYYSVKEGQQSDQSNIVKSIARDIDNTLWVGTYDGLIHFDPKSGKTKMRILQKEDETRKREIMSVLADENGIWVASNISGLYFLDRKKHITQYQHTGADKYSISSNNVTALLKTDRYGIWIGTSRGLNYLDFKTNHFTRFYNNPNSSATLSNNTVICLFKDAERNLWIGTQGGLNFHSEKSKKFSAITESEGLPNNVVHAIQQAKDGSLWISTNRGLSNIRFDNTLTPDLSRASILNYTADDGLPSNQFSDRAVTSSSEGELFYGGINGLTYFYPSKLVRNTTIPRVVFTGFEIKNNPITVLSENSPLSEPINNTTHLTLAYDEAFISIEFAALNFNNPGKNQYAYKLDGLRNDNGWHYTSSQRKISYTNLSAGNYTFKVKAANNDGAWNNTPKELNITILPPPWKTWWAYILYALTILFLLYSFYYYSYKTTRLKHQLEIEHKLHEKDEELAQRKLSFFTNISHEIKTPLTLILAPIDKMIDMNEGNNKVQNQLMLMQRNGERLVRLIGQLLDFRKFESGNMKLNAAQGDLVLFSKEVLTAFEAYAADRKIKLKFRPELNKLMVWYDADKLEKILYNLLSNAVKFTPEGGEVVLVISKKASEAVISVKDNGIGMDSAQQKMLFKQFYHSHDKNMNATGSGIGLAFTKGLVELHHGRILVESQTAVQGSEGYTCFEIRLPIGSAHLKSDEIVPEQNANQVFISEQETTGTDLKAITKFDDSIEKPVILIVEDNSEVLEFIASCFEDKFKIFTAVNGSEGWRLAVEQIPDMVISDVMMPEMNGTILCSKLKSDPRTSHIPVILLTARSPLIYKIEGLETGADDYITKPFSIRVLKTRVSNLLEMRKKLRERFSQEIYLQPTNMAITSPDEKFLKKIMDFIDVNMDDPGLNVEEMGRIVGMSRATLYRKIKSLTNQTAVEFIRGVRLKRAAQLIEQNKLHINEVAFMVGFVDVDYFRKCFKEQFGHTPREYANQIKDS